MDALHLAVIAAKALLHEACAVPDLDLRVDIGIGDLTVAFEYREAAVYYDDGPDGDGEIVWEDPAGWYFGPVAFQGQARRQRRSMNDQRLQGAGHR